MMDGKEEINSNLEIKTRNMLRLNSGNRHNISDSIVVMVRLYHQVK
jgi:hypothetical protein